MERKLFLTIVAGLVPLAVLALILLLQSAQSQRQELLDSSQRTMLAIMAAVDSEFDATVASLDALAASPRLAVDDMAGFRAEAIELLARRSAWLNVVLSDSSARQLVNARAPLGQPLPMRVEDISTSPVVAASIAALADRRP